MLPLIMLVVVAASARAEEDHLLMPALSQTTLTGYVDTSAIWCLEPPTHTLVSANASSITVATTGCTSSIFGLSYHLPAGAIQIEWSYVAPAEGVAPLEWEVRPALSVGGMPGARYRIEYGGEADGVAKWEFLAEIVIPETNARVAVIDLLPAGPRRFYRAVPI